MFQVGDRVVCVVNVDHLCSGDTGTVCCLESFGVGVRWDKWHESQHDCRGLCESGYGWFMLVDQIELFSDEPEAELVLLSLDSIL